MGIFPDILPPILRRDACEIVALPKHACEPQQDYSVRISVGQRPPKSRGGSETIELDPLQPESKNERKDSIFAVHENNVAISRSNSHHIVAKDIKTYTDQTICLLIDNINQSRRGQGMQPFTLSPELCEQAAFHASGTTCPPSLSVPGSAYGLIRARHVGLRRSNTRVERIMFSGRGVLQGAHHAVKLISAEGLGALACSELWLSGKYKKHVYPIRSNADHASDCACAEYEAYNVIMDSKRREMGVSRDAWGRWVVILLDVELW